MALPLVVNPLGAVNWPPFAIHPLHLNVCLFIFSILRHPLLDFCCFLTWHEPNNLLGSAHHGIITHCPTGPAPKALASGAITRQVEFDACAYRALHSRTTDQEQSQKAQVIAVQSVRLLFFQILIFLKKCLIFLISSSGSSAFASLPVPDSVPSLLDRQFLPNPSYAHFAAHKRFKR